MRKVLSVMLLIMITFGMLGCAAPQEIPREDIVDKVYVYEKDGCGGNFTIEIRADGTYDYYEGFLSSYIGLGEWSYSDGILTLYEEASRFNEAREIEEVTNLYCFTVEKDALIFSNKSSANFRYVKVAYGEKFLAAPSR
jgi:hypothetical protein